MCIVPKMMKIAKVLPIYKSGEKKKTYKTIDLYQFYQLFPRYLRGLCTTDLAVIWIKSKSSYRIIEKINDAIDNGEIGIGVIKSLRQH